MFKYRIIGRKNPQTKEKKFYAQGEPVNPVSLSDIANEISGMCTLTAHDIKAVLSARARKRRRASKRIAPLPQQWR